MAKKRQVAESVRTERPGRVELTGEESLKRVKEFAKRKEQFIATVRKGKNRSVSA